MTGRTFSGPMACTPRTHDTAESIPPDRAMTSLCRPAAPNTLRMKLLIRASICGQSMLDMGLLSFDSSDSEGLWGTIMHIDNYLAAKPRRGRFTAPSADLSARVVGFICQSPLSASIITAINAVIRKAAVADKSAL